MLYNGIYLTIIKYYNGRVPVYNFKTQQEIRHIITVVDKTVASILRLKQTFSLPKAANVV